MKRILISLLSFPITLLAEGGLPNQPYLYVVGTTEIQKPADMVTIQFNLVARAPEQAKANEEVQTKAVKILELFKSRKIAEHDVIAESLRSEPEFEQDDVYRRNRGKLVGYTVSRRFEVKILDLTAFPKLVDELLAIGGVEVSDIDGGLSKEKQMLDEAWAKALTNAREQAEKTLKPIDSVFAVSPVTFTAIENKIFDSVERVGVRGAQLAVQTIPQYRLAPITLSQSVHVIYLISPAK